MKLHKFQADEVLNLKKTFKKHDAACLAWYTGAGKTNVFLTLCKEYIEENPNIKIGISCYFTMEVRDQVYERTKELGIQDKAQLLSCDRGLAPIDKTKNIFIFAPQSLAYTKPDIKFDLFIVDEGHAGMAEDCSLIRNIRQACCKKTTKTLIVSATPWDTLALKEFAGIPVHKRPLDLGLQDGLAADFDFYAEEAQIEFSEEDFTRKGDLNRSVAIRSFQILKSACLGKMGNIVTKHSKRLGKKVLVICPPGNSAEIAWALAHEFGGLVFIQRPQIAGMFDDTSQNLALFKEGETRFLFVINKCQVGFDMKELDSVIDLTMSRNVRVLAQRMGRISRNNGKRKSYFYVYDKSLMKDRLEWLVMTMVDFCLGSFDGWTTRTAKWRKVAVPGGGHRIDPEHTLLSKVISALRSAEGVETQLEIKYLSKERPLQRTLEYALAAAAKFESRTDMWKRNPALYKWFRISKNMGALLAVFPLKTKHRWNYWNEKTLVSHMNEFKTRRQFFKKYPGTRDFIKRENLQHLVDIHLPALHPPTWDEKSILKYLGKHSNWRLATHNRVSIMKWMEANGGKQEWKERFLRERRAK